MKKGYYAKYKILKADTGKPVQGSYFVLKLDSTNKRLVRASQAAALTYAREIESFDPDIAQDLRVLVGRARLDEKDFEQWFDELTELAKSEGAIWLIDVADPNAYREGWEQGLTPEEKLEETKGECMNV